MKKSIAAIAATAMLAVNLSGCAKTYTPEQMVAEANSWVNYSDTITAGMTTDGDKFDANIAYTVAGENALLSKVDLTMDSIESESGEKITIQADNLVTYVDRAVYINLGTLIKVCNGVMAAAGGATVEDTLKGQGIDIDLTKLKNYKLPVVIADDYKQSTTAKELENCFMRDGYAALTKAGYKFEQVDKNVYKLTVSEADVGAEKSKEVLTNFKSEVEAHKEEYTTLFSKITDEGEVTVIDKEATKAAVKTELNAALADIAEKTGMTYESTSSIDSAIDSAFASMEEQVDSSVAADSLTVDKLIEGIDNLIEELEDDTSSEDTEGTETESDEHKATMVINMSLLTEDKTDVFSLSLELKDETDGTELIAATTRTKGTDKDVISAPSDAQTLKDITSLYVDDIVKILADMYGISVDDFKAELAGHDISEIMGG